VTATEFKFALSRRSVPKGTTVIFKVTNKGKIEHDFKINGKKTKTLKPGQSTSLRVVFSRKGRLTYLCTIPGHAKVGMKGVFGVSVTPPKITTTQTTTTTTTTTTGSTTTVASCSPATTQVSVSMIEYAFIVNGVRNGGSVPAGCIQFNIKNDGQVVHNFALIGIKAGTIISPGATDTFTVQLTPGSKNYTCDVPFHDSFGMSGALTVT
jgi:uncharacterized cupredoxin-like copper-binding protein